MAGLSPYQVVEDGQKVCSRCERKLPLDRFAKNARYPSGHLAACWDCRKQLPSQTPERRREASKKYWRGRGGDEFRRKRYGVSPEQYAEMVKRQQGRCALCGGPPTKKGLQIDHDHETGVVRSLLCHSCNVGLGHFRESPELLRAAIEYLEGEGM